MGKYVKILGTGYFVPPTVVTNKQLIEHLDTTDEWIVNNLGIRERRVGDQGENSSYIGGWAARQAINRAGLKEDEIDMIIVATSTPDKLSPSTACIIKDDLRLINAVAFDISAVCSGFLFGMSVAEQYILSGTYKNILVIGVDIFSTITDWKRRDCVFFGDGGGAVVMSASEELGFAGFVLYSDSENRDGFYCNHGENFNMDTRRVYNSAIKLLPLAINGILERCDMTINDIDYIIPHQPSIRILMEVARRVKIPIERVLMNMDKYGNTVAATIPILLHESWNKFKEGDVILFAAIGSGWTYGASIYII